MPLLPNELARRENGRLELRSGPVRVRWNLDDLVTADGHRLHCTFTCSVAALSAPAEWKMLEEVFLAKAMGVTTEDVVRHFAPGFRSAAAGVAREFRAEAFSKGDKAALAALEPLLGEQDRAAVAGVAAEEGMRRLMQRSRASPSSESCARPVSHRRFHSPD